MPDYVKNWNTKVLQPFHSWYIYLEYAKKATQMSLQSSLQPPQGRTKNNAHFHSLTSIH